MSVRMKFEIKRRPPFPYFRGNESGGARKRIKLFQLPFSVNGYGRMVAVPAAERVGDKQITGIAVLPELVEQFCRRQTGVFANDPKFPLLFHDLQNIMLRVGDSCALFGQPGRTGGAFRVAERGNRSGKYDISSCLNELFQEFKRSGAQGECRRYEDGRIVHLADDELTTFDVSILFRQQRFRQQIKVQQPEEQPFDQRGEIVLCIFSGSCGLIERPLKQPERFNRMDHRNMHKCFSPGECDIEPCKMICDPMIFPIPG